MDVARIHWNLNRLGHEVSYSFKMDNTRVLKWLLISVKLIGLFVTALVGLYTIEDLWEKFGDLKMSWVRTVTSCFSIVTE